MGRFGTAIDSKCFNPSRIFYYPSCPADRVDYFEFARQEGDAFDWESLCDTNTPTAANSGSTVIPEHLQRLFNGKGNLAPATRKPIGEGGRNNELHRRGCAMRGQGMELDEIAGELLKLNADLCKPPLDSSEVLTIAESVCRYPAGVRGAPINTQTTTLLSGVTELALAKMIDQAYGGRFHYVAESSKFHVFDESSGVWADDYSGQIQRWFFKILEDGKEAAFDMIRKSNNDGDRLLAAIRKAERQNVIQGAMTLLKSLTNITIRQTRFDANPYLVAFADGQCADLQTGEIRQIRADDYVTKTLGTHFDPAADCPMWRSSLNDWTRGDSELVRFLQVLIGYSLSGLTEVQQFFFLYGGGQNGKSVFTTITSELLGDYAKAIGSESLMLKPNGAESTNDMARLQGARLITAAELPEGKVFDEQRIKALTGGDSITARFLYGEFFEFVCAAVLMVSGNHKPVVKGTDFGFWRRMNLIPFLASVSNPDRQLTSKLRAELAGILNWALEGWRIYQQEGLVIPESVRRESAAYRAEMDIVGQWLDTCTKPKIGNKIKARDVYASFKDWAIGNGFHVPNSSSFGRKLEGRLTNGRDGNGRYYRDIDLTYGG